MGSPGGLVGAVIVAVVLGAALFAPYVSPYNPDALDVLDRFGPLSARHWLGTDQIGRDLLSRLLHGATVAMEVSLSSILIALVLGTLLGVLAAAASPAWERLLLILFDVISAFPSLVLALAIVAVFGPSNEHLVGIVAVTLVPHFGRVARAQALALRSAPFLEAERILGASWARIVLRHVLPNIAGPLIVLASMEIPVVITIEAGLSFIGLGVRPPLASWGTLIYDGYAYLSDSVLPVLVSSLALAVATLGFTLFGEALRDATGPAEPDVTALLDIRDLHLEAATPRGTAHILRGISLTIPKGRIVGIVGESGSGKSSLALAILRLLPGNVTRLAGSIRLDGRELVGLAEAGMAELRGRRIAMVFQDPATALNPVFTVGTQLVDVLRRQEPGLSRRAALVRAEEALRRVEIADPARRLRAYAHELSGGMRQRVMIAMALLVRPDLLLADEPTTALDATVEAGIVALFERLRTELDGSILFISHHLGLVATLCDDIAVLYGGQVLETGPAGDVCASPRHPYTAALLACEPGEAATGPLATIPGDVPDPVDTPTGCIFAPRCGQAEPACGMPQPLRAVAPGREAACWKAA